MILSVTALAMRRSFTEFASKLPSKFLRFLLSTSNPGSIERASIVWPNILTGLFDFFLNSTKILVWSSVEEKNMSNFMVGQNFNITFSKVDFAERKINLIVNRRSLSSKNYRTYASLLLCPYDLQF